MISKIAVYAFVVFSLIAIPVFAVAEQAQTQSTQQKQDLQIEKPLYNPFIERYILDEIKQLRTDQQILRTEMAEKVAEARLTSSDRAMRYTADTTNNIFYIITAAASILVLVGWRSFREIRESVESITSAKLTDLTAEYEQRLEEIEKNLKNRSNQVLINQEEIARTNQIHSLWMRAGLEKSDQEKVSTYDQILALNPDDVEAISYKADVLLDIGEKKWALSLADQAIEKDPEYSFAYWQRACSKAELGMLDDAVDDIEIAIRLSEALREQLETEKSFFSLKGNERYDTLVDTIPVDSSNT